VALYSIILGGGWGSTAGYRKLHSPLSPLLKAEFTEEEQKKATHLSIGSCLRRLLAAETAMASGEGTCGTDFPPDDFLQSQAFFKNCMQSTQQSCVPELRLQVFTVVTARPQPVGSGGSPLASSQLGTPRGHSLTTWLFRRNSVRFTHCGLHRRSPPFISQQSIAVCLHKTRFHSTAKAEVGEGPHLRRHESIGNRLLGKRYHCVSIRRCLICLISGPHLSQKIMLHMHT